MPITIEMTNSQCEKYVKHVLIEDNNKKGLILFPRDCEFLKYWKYRKEILFDKIRKNMIRFDNEYEFKPKIIKEYTNVTYNTYKYLVFEFPDEMEEEDFLF